MEHFQSSEVVVSGKHLVIFAVNLQKKGSFNALSEIVLPVFTELAPFMKNEHQVLYIRDIPKYCIDEKLLYGNAYVENEVTIAVPQWPANKSQLISTIAHELHHLARWQTVGYGKTLGEATVSEGFATWYGIEKSDWIPPWAQVSITEDMKKKAFQEWDSSKYDHKNWFYKGTMGRWIGYGLGYGIVRAYLDNTFNLKESLFAKAEDMKQCV